MKNGLSPENVTVVDLLFLPFLKKKKKKNKKKKKKPRGKFAFDEFNKSGAATEEILS